MLFKNNATPWILLETMRPESKCNGNLSTASLPVNGNNDMEMKKFKIFETSIKMVHLIVSFGSNFQPVICVVVGVGVVFSKLRV